MSKAIPVYMPKFEPSKPSSSTTHSKKRSSQTRLKNAQADPLNLKMKPVAEIGDDSSYVCPTTTDGDRKETLMQTEGNSYVGVAINQEALDCSFDTGHNFYHDTETKGNLKKKKNKKNLKVKGPLMTLNSPTREERNISSPQNALINPFTTTAGTLETEARATENNEEMVESEGQLEEETKKRFKFSFSVSNRFCFFFYLMFAVGISVGSVFLSTSSINLVDSPYVTNSIIALVTIGLSNYIFQKSFFVKKRPKIFNLMSQNPLNMSIYHFPLSYWVYRGLSVGVVLFGVGILTNFLLKFPLYERVAIIVSISAGVSLISQLLFALYYMKIYKQNLKNLRPKTFLNIPGVKNNKYNEFMDDLKNVKTHIATLKTERDGDEETPPATDKEPESDKEPQLLENNPIKHLPSMSKKHIFCGNLIFFSFAAALIINLMVPLTISKAFNSAKPPESGITVWGLASGPVIYTGLSGLTGIIFKRCKFQADFLVDVLLFLGIIGSYKAIFLVYPSRQSNTLTDLIIFTGGKMLWKYLVYLYQMYKLSPSEENKGQAAIYKKKQTETGEVVELFKRSHVNFGMKIWFWQYSDIALSIAYLILLPLITFKSYNQFSHLKHYKAILNPMITLVGEAILEIGGLFLMRYLFIKSNPVVKRVNFVSNLQNYSKQNLAILMLACIFVVFLSINILDITLSFV